MLVRLLRVLSDTPLFRRVKPPQNQREIIGWWEARRIPYNLFVGGAGVLASIVILATGFITEHFTGEAIGIPDPPLFAVLAVMAYGVMANVCFTGGWILELISRRVWNERADAFGEIAFMWGTLGSMVLTLLPAAVIVVFGIIRILYPAGH